MQQERLVECAADASGARVAHSQRFRDAVRRFRVAHVLDHFHVNRPKTQVIQRTAPPPEGIAVRRLKSARTSLLGRFVSDTVHRSPGTSQSTMIADSSAHHLVSILDDNHQIESGQGKIDDIDTTRRESTQNGSSSAETPHPATPENDDVEKPKQKSNQINCQPATGALTKDQVNPDDRKTEDAENPSSRIPAFSDSDSEGVRVYKKISANDKLVLYLINRDLLLTQDSVATLHAVITVDPEEMKNKKVFAQILLTFRYGRDDEEVMGLKLSNESVLCIEQIYPPLTGAPLPSTLTKCQEVLIRRLGPTAYAVNLKLNPPVPTSVRLLPAKEYRGASIGISYDLRIYTAESVDDKISRRGQVRMAIRVVQYVPDDIKRTAAPQLTLEKHFLMRECGIQLDTRLDRQWYDHGMPVLVKIRICNRSSRVVRKIQMRIIQHVDVTMFSNGKFKNTIVTSEESEGFPVASGHTFENQYEMNIKESSGGSHWVALEDRYGRITTTLASTTLKAMPGERNFFAIYISYYVKIRLVVSGVASDISTKIPFILMREGPESFTGEFDDFNPTGGNSDGNPPLKESNSIGNEPECPKRELEAQLEKMQLKTEPQAQCSTSADSNLQTKALDVEPHGGNDSAQEAIVDADA